MKYNIIIVGAGAAGMAAAIAAKEQTPSLSVAVIERNDRAGKKIAVTGNGRCNITNRDLSLSRFHGNNSSFATDALSEYGLDYTKTFFNKLGVVIAFSEDGKAYPASFQASSVVDSLRFKMAELGIELITGERVKSIVKGFKIHTDRADYSADRVILAVGGSAAPKLGSDGCAAGLLKPYGHKFTNIYPAIVQLKTDTTYVRQMKGIKFDGAVSIIVDGKIHRVESGEILFTEYGISGPPVLAVSRIAAQYLGFAEVSVSLDIMPGIYKDKLCETLEARSALLRGRTCGEYFTGMLNKRLGQVVLKRCGLSVNDDVSVIGAEKAAEIAALLTDFRLKVTGTNGFANAQTTAGGLSTSQFDSMTMESKLCRGLYAAGEALDIDGDCGGYNLQWAWSSGITAGISAAESLR